MKRIIAIILALTLCLALCGCCKHQWQEATCTEPQSCSLCDKTKGEALGHDWQAATCIEAETCSRCGETQGEPLGHTPGQIVEGELDIIMGERMDWQICSVCDELIKEKRVPCQLFDEEHFLFTEEGFIGRFEAVHKDSRKVGSIGFTFVGTNLNRQSSTVAVYMDYGWAQASWIRYIYPPLDSINAVECTHTVQISGNGEIEADSREDCAYAAYISFHVCWPNYWQYHKDLKLENTLYEMIDSCFNDYVTTASVSKELAGLNVELCMERDEKYSDMIDCTWTFSPAKSK